MEKKIADTQNGKYPYLTFPALERTGLVIHAFSTKHGGVSEGPCATMNLSWKNDSRENVIENRRRFLKALGLELESLVAGQQVHGTNVAVVTKSDRGRGSVSYGEALPATDALITASSEVTLSAYFADCVPLFFFDPMQRVIGLAHAGWRGTIGKIGQRTIKTMEKEFGVNPIHCLVGIGPSIGPCCYEVDQQVITSLAKVFPYWTELVIPQGQGKWRLNLWETNRRQLLDIGVKAENIFCSSLCTSCTSELFFSYRAHAKKTGALAAIIALRGK
jgi:YfiH family protein